jgi:hypothetical protein
MRTIINSLAVLFGLFIILSSQSCKKDDDKNDNNNTNQSKNLSFTYENYYYDYLWVILHNSDGSEVVDFKKVNGNGVADFGTITGGIATYSIVKVDTSVYKKDEIFTYVYIQTFYNAPCIDWKYIYSSSNHDSLGYAEIIMTYPEGIYGGYLISSNYFSTSSTSVPSDGVQKSYAIHDVDEGSKISLYGVVYSSSGGYCNWLLNQDFQQNQVNTYNLDLTNSFVAKTLNSNLPLDYISCSGFINQRKTRLNMFGKSYYDGYGNGETDHLINIPDNIPLEEFSLYGSSFGDNSGYIYRKYYNQAQGVPADFEIPLKSVSASYDQTTNTINNIQVNGQVDQVLGNWYYDDYSSFYLSWRVNANYDVTTLKTPTLPQEVINELGIATNMILASSIGIYDLDVTKNFADLVNRNGMAQPPPYNQSFYYETVINGSSQKLNKEHLDKMKKADKWDF